MHYPSNFEKICYGPNVFLGNQIKGIISVLCSFEHEQYLSNSVNLWCLIIEYLNDSIGFFIWLCNIPTSFKIYVLEPNVFLG
jgi:hypothetical protein